FLSHFRHTTQPYPIGQPDRSDPAFSCRPFFGALGRAAEGARQDLNHAKTLVCAPVLTPRPSTCYFHRGSPAVAELADAADSKANIAPLLKPTHRYTSENKVYLVPWTKRLRFSHDCSFLLTEWL